MFNITEESDDYCDAIEPESSVEIDNPLYLRIQRDSIIGKHARSDGDLPNNFVCTPPASLRKLKSDNGRQRSESPVELKDSLSDVTQSLDLAVSIPTPSFGARTTSNLEPHEIIGQLCKALHMKQVEYTFSGPHKLNCECRIFRQNPTKGKSSGPPKLQRARSTKDALELLSWEMEVCYLPKLDMHGIRLRRVCGDIWKYKQKISDVMALVNL